MRLWFCNKQFGFVIRSHAGAAGALLVPSSGTRGSGLTAIYGCSAVLGPRFTSGGAADAEGGELGSGRVEPVLKHGPKRRRTGVNAPQRDLPAVDAPWPILGLNPRSPRATMRPGNSAIALLFHNSNTLKLKAKGPLDGPCHPKGCEGQVVSYRKNSLLSHNAEPAHHALGSRLRACRPTV